MRARTHVPCIGRWILNHCATREALGRVLELGSAPNPATDPLDVIIHRVSKAEPITLLRQLIGVKVLSERTA